MDHPWREPLARRQERMRLMRVVGKQAAAGRAPRGRVVMHGSMVRAEVPVHLVRAGSAEHRNRWSSTGTSGHSGQEEAAGYRAFPPTTTAVEAARKRLRIPPDGCRGPASPSVARGARAVTRVSRRGPLSLEP